MGAAATLAGALWASAASAAPPEGAAQECCQDLEERVAELEATAARKGNRKVSLEIYGQVNRALYMWDDGRIADTYIVDNNFTSTRMGLKGDGKIDAGWKSGFNIEFEFVDASSNQVSQFPTLSGTTAQILGGDEGGGEVGPINIRQAYWYVESEKLGRVSLGHQSQATDDISIINLSGANGVSDARVLWNGNFIVRGPVTGDLQTVVRPTTTPWGGLVLGGGLRWNMIANGLDSERADIVRYDTPSIYGFILSASWGESVMWDVGLRFAKEWETLRIAAGIGYWAQDDAFNVFTGSGQAGYANGANARRQEIKGSASVLHIPTGLYFSLAAGELQNRGFNPPDAGFWYIQGGLDRKFFSYGNTTVFGEYGSYTDFGVDAYGISGTNLAGPVLIPSRGFLQSAYALAPPAQGQGLAESNVDRWGVGAVQKFDGAALSVYAVYQHWEADVSYWSAARGVTPAGVAVAAPTKAFDGAAVGARIKF